MGVDTKSGPSMNAQYAELGVIGEHIAEIARPGYQCNASFEQRGPLSIEAENQGYQQTGGNLSSGDARGSSGAVDVNSPPLRIPEQISPSLNPRGPAGANGHQFPRVDPHFSSVPGGGGNGARFGNAGGNQVSPTYGIPRSGDISINDSGGISVSVSTGGQPALTVDHGPQSIENPQDTFPPVTFQDPGFPEGGGGIPGGGGGGGGAGPPGQEVEKDPCKPAETKCDHTFAGTVCADKLFADNIHIRWGKASGTLPAYINGKPGVGNVTLTPVGAMCSTTDRDTEDADTTTDDVGAPPDAGEGINKGEDNLPPCPPDDNNKKQPAVDEDGAKNDGQPADNAVDGAGPNNDGADAGGSPAKAVPSNSTTGSVTVTLGPDSSQYA